MFGFHLDCARVISCIGEHDIGKAFTLMGGSLAWLLRDLHLNCTDIARNPAEMASDPLAAQMPPHAASAGIRALDVQ